MQFDEVRLLLGVEFGLLAAQPALGLGDLHPLAGAHPDQVGLELRDHGQHVEQQPAYRIAGVVHRAADVELDTAAGEVFDDVAGVGQRASQPVELGDDEGVPIPARGESFAQSGASAGGAGESLIDVDPFRGDAKGGKRVALRGEVLFVGGDPGVADQHSWTVAVSTPSPGISSGGSCGTSFVQRARSRLNP